MERYLSVNTHLSESTKGLIRLSFRYLMAAYGDIEADSIGRTEAQFFYGLMLKRDVTPRTVATYVETIRTVWQECPYNPWHVKKVRYVPEKKKPYSQEELVRILSACPDSRWKLIISLATLGLRRSEILNLTIDDVDFNSQTLMIRPTPQTKKTWKWQLKTRDTREVPMTDLVYQHLEDVVLTTMTPYPCVSFKRYMYLRPKIATLSERTRNCPENNFRRTFIGILDKAGVQNKTFHALRGTAATIMNKNGLTLPEIMAILGHKKVDTTMRHYMSTPDDLMERAKHSLFNGR